MSKPIEIHQNDILITEGDSSKAMYLLMTGKLEVIQSKGGKKVRVGTISAGEIVGEMSFIDKSRRSATVVAMTDCELIEVSTDVFEKHLEKQPAWWHALLKTLVARVRNANKLIRI